MQRDESAFPTEDCLVRKRAEDLPSQYLKDSKRPVTDQRCKKKLKRKIRESGAIGDSPTPVEVLE